jgi:hypothetical protein
MFPFGGSQRRRAAGVRFHGLLIVSQKLDVRSAIEELILIWTASEAEEWINTVCAIPF